MSIKGKKILLAITGSIAAYKMPHFVRLLVKEGAEVKIVVTDAAKHFVSALSLSVVSHNPVLSTISEGAAWNNHVHLALWADVLLIAPCSANTLAKLANGLCDNLLCAVYLSARCPVLIAPAMDEDMWLHPSTKANLDKVTAYGDRIIPTAHGELASGLVGEGRMAEPETILTMLNDHFSADHKQLSGTKALVTAGPTYERLDPVRFIGNFSTGKMGIAIAEALADNGADVTLVLGPGRHTTVHAGVHTIAVESAEDMYNACSAAFSTTDIAVLAAAVADYKPKERAAEKIKKKDEELTLPLARTVDILASLGKIKQQGQTLVGFALETNNEVANATEKLTRKNADMIILNSLKDEGAGFGHDTNKITIIKRDTAPVSMPLQSKTEVAKAIVDQIIELRYAEKMA